LKKAFGIMTALFILVLVSFLLMLILKVSSIGVKHVGDSYISSQAELFMQTSIENALMAIEGYQRDNDTGCLKHINFISSDGRFESNTTVLRYYCYDMNDCPNCDIAVQIQTDKSHGNVLLNTIVYTTNSPRNNNKKLKFSRVTLQKP